MDSCLEPGVRKCEELFDKGFRQDLGCAVNFKVSNPISPSHCPRKKDTGSECLEQKDVLPQREELDQHRDITPFGKRYFLFFSLLICLWSGAERRVQLK